MHELPLLLNISVGLAAAFIGGLVARRLGLPVILGYLMAGIAIGPFTPGFVGDTETIQQLAELGVIFLMFGVGLHFSFQDLWRVRAIAIPGALGQILMATLLGFLLSQSWGWSVSASVVLGFSISIASTVVLLRNLMDRNLLNTTHGQVAIGWLVFEDLATIFILLMLPSLAPEVNGFSWQGVAFTLLKAAVFVALMVLIGKQFIPWVLNRIANTRSRELFILAVLAIALSTAVGAAEMFGVSLALGAFAAGAIISESHLSYQVGADVLPFQEAFSVLFFVSIGMLVNPAFLLTHWSEVLTITSLVVVGKILITLVLGAFIPGQARTFLVVAAGLSQIGEFSFIVGQTGMVVGLLDRNQYSLILAAALISITMNPLLFRSIPAAENMLHRFTPLWKRLDTQPHASLAPVEATNAPVVVVGFGRVGQHLLNVLKTLNMDLVFIETDPERVAALNAQGVPAIYGDASNSEVLTHLGLERAKALVVTVPNEAAAELIVAAAHEANPRLPIIARAAVPEGIQRLSELGATFVIHPELEGGLEMVRHTLLQLGLPRREVDSYAEEVRSTHYEFSGDQEGEHELLKNMLRAAGEMEITWITPPAESWIFGRTLVETNLRGLTGASVVAIIRDRKLIPNPKSSTVFEEGDRLGVIGEPAQIAKLETFLQSGTQ